MKTSIKLVAILVVALGCFLCVQKPSPTAQIQPFNTMSTPAPAQVTINPYAQYEPDPKLSPGDVNPDLTAAVLSSPGFTTKKYRNVPQSVKDQVYAEYNITSHKPGDYEVDHIISLELGGSNDIKNLWPQPYHGLWNAHMKDKLENKLNEMVKTNQIELADAQKAISTDWVGAYLKYVDPNSDGTH